MQDLDPSNICKKIFLNPLKRIRVIIRTPTHGRTDGRTDRQTDRRTDEQGESSIPPLNFVSGGIIINYPLPTHIKMLSYKYRNLRIWSHDNFIFIMWIHVLEKMVFILKPGPGSIFCSPDHDLVPLEFNTFNIYHGQQNEYDTWYKTTHVHI